MSSTVFLAGDRVGPARPPTAPPVQPGQLPIRRPAAEQSQGLTFTLTLDDLVVPLVPAAGFRPQAGVEGLDETATEVVERAAGGVDGGFYGGTTVASRVVLIPLLLDAATPAGLRDLKRQLRDVTNHRRGVTRLTVSTRGNVERWVEGYRYVPQQSAWGAETFGETWQFLDLYLKCLDPWWRSSATALEWTSLAPVDFYPYPRTIGSDTVWEPVNASRNVQDPAVVDVTADGGALPLWEFTGPATQISGVHVDTGRSWTVVQALSAGEKLFVDTDPRNAARVPAVRNAAGQSRYSALAAPRDLWTLPPGRSEVEVTITGLGTGSAAKMTPVPLWDTAT